VLGAALRMRKKKTRKKKRRRLLALGRQPETFGSRKRVNEEWTVTVTK